MANRLIYTLSPSDKHKVYGTSTLPTEFINYLRTLFELLDKGNNGYIKVSDLEKYWGNEYQLDDSTSNSLIIKRLYEISPGNAGLLSFPRLCSGVKEALLQVKRRKMRPKSFINALHLEENFTKETNEMLSEDSKSEGDSSSSLSPALTATITRRPGMDAMSSRYVEGCEDKTNSNSTGNLLAFGMQMIDKINSWYSRLNSQYYYKRETSDLPSANLSKVEHINNKLSDILKVQSQQDRPFSHNDEEKSLKIVVKKQEERILQLEGEKSLLIRELFQLKAQLKSPASKGNFPLFD